MKARRLTRSTKATVGKVYKIVEIMPTPVGDKVIYINDNGLKSNSFKSDWEFL